MAKDKKKEGKDTFNSKIAFILSLGFFIPLFNVGLAIAALIIGVMSLRRINAYPEKFGGLGYSIAAIALSVTTLILSVIFISIWMYRRMTCDALPKLF